MHQMITSNATMTSREIAELVESRHNDVKRSIERLVEKGVIQSTPMANFKNINNVEGQEYVFTGEQGKRDSIIVVAQLSPEFTARLVDRWQQLEAAAAQPMDPTLQLAHAVLLANQMIERQNLMISEMQPKADFFDAVTDSKDAVDIGTVAKVLNMGIGRTRLFQFLREEKVLMQDNRPYQHFVDEGYFRVIESTWNKSDGSTHVNYKTVVYQKGVAYIRKKLIKAGYVHNAPLVRAA